MRGYEITLPNLKAVDIERKKKYLPKGQMRN